MLSGPLLKPLFQRAGVVAIFSLGFMLTVAWIGFLAYALGTLIGPPVEAIFNVLL